MALSTKELFLIGTTALVVGASTYFVTKSAFSGPTPPPDGASERIEWDEATARRNEYKAFKPLYTRGADGGLEVLQGFIFEAGHLHEIINKNSSPAGNPDKVMFFFGQDGTFTPPSSLTAEEYPVINVIAVGVKDDELLDDAKLGYSVSVFDKADPCPPNCPE